MHVTVESYLFHNNAGALFELCAKITQKRKQDRKPIYNAAVNIAAIHLKLEIGCFGGAGLAKKHAEEY